MPEKQLWQAVLIQMCKDLRFPKSEDPRNYMTQKRERDEAMSWFRSRSCREVCEMAGIDHRTVMRMYLSGKLTKLAMEGAFEKGNYLVSRRRG